MVEFRMRLQYHSPRTVQKSLAYIRTVAAMNASRPALEGKESK